MQISNNQNQNFKAMGGIRLLGNLRVLLTMALFIALSMVFKRIGFTMGPFRISFENLPLLLAGVMFGPVVGFVTGAVGDVFGCLFSGFSINPFITLGAGSIGFVSGIVSFYCLKSSPRLRIIAAVALAHIIGSMIIKSLGLYVYYHYELSALLLRVPLYIIIGSVEGYITCVLMGNKAFLRQLERVQMR